MVDDTLQRVRDDVVACRLCPRLVTYRERVALERKREFRNEAYWGKPVPGFGDPQARLVGVGLAPAAHGSNRTGRMFTGDRSAAFLVRALYDAGYASQPTSVRRGDGLSYRDFFLTAGVRCAPPDNRPRPDERVRCRPFLERELRLLTNARALLAFGGFAWDATLDAAAGAFEVKRPQVPFGHGAAAPLGPGKPMVWASFHPSPQNTNTGKLTHPMLVDLLGRVRASYE
ncbi:MAG: uracil-DNA glycosylase [Thermoplasmata archaeon]|jgi:uracil-DNA glycosylase family 4|nr:uracil-DNA glycosylase [Thermoplasmata archaeon]